MSIVPLSEIQKGLRHFKLSGMSETLEVRLKQAVDDNLSYIEFLEMMLEDEKNKRADNKKRRLYHSARLPFEKGIEDFDFTFQPSIKKQEILELSTCHFLEKAVNIILIGQPGTRKTHISVGIALSALGHGKRVLFTTVWEMINVLQQSRADYSYQKKIEQYLKADLLILDELGYRSMSESTVEDFFEIVSKRYEKGSIIITSNKPIHQWDSVFIDKTLTTAVVDRLLHHSSVIEIKGESYRFKRRD